MELAELDKIIPRILRLGMNSGQFLKLEYVYGFEYFNTRPYHNYETWAGGWRLTDEKNNIQLEEEYLEQAIRKWIKLIEEKEEKVNG